MSDTVRSVVRRLLRRFPTLLLALLVALPLPLVSYARLAADLSAQRKRVETLAKQYAAGEIAPVDEAAFFAGDLQKALDDGIKYNETAFLATHNSYQTASVAPYRRVCELLSPVLPELLPAGSGTLDQPTLTEQLQCGIRSFELDAEAYSRCGKTGFYCLHSPVIDMTSHSPDLALALREIALWSDNNPGHLPVTILIEPKVKFVPMPSTRFFSIEYADALDELLRRELGARLLMPADMLRDYPDFAAMRRADDWLPLAAMRGRVLALLHYDWSEQGEILNTYMAQDETFRTQAMFPLHVDGSLANACFLAYNDPQTVLSLDAYLRENRFVVRTRVDEHPVYSAERYAEAIASCANILSTDYPPRTDRQADHTAALPGGKTVRMIPAKPDEGGASHV